MNGNINTILIIITFLIILCFFKIVMNNQEKILKKLSSVKEQKAEDINTYSDHTIKEQVKLDKKGFTKGDIKIIGEDNYEVIAVIMASVSNYSNIPLQSLNIKYIKKL